MSTSTLGAVYGARTLEEQEAAYDRWSADYDRELMAMGYRIPAVTAAVVARFVAPDATPILDAGCGSGLHAEALALVGFAPFVGIDLSEGMLAVARGKGIYQELRRMALGSRLDFPDDHFAAVMAMGALTPGHAPAESLVDLVRVARPGAPVLFTLRSDPGHDPAYDATCARLVAEGSWRHRFTSPDFPYMPLGAPEIVGRMHVYEVA